MKPKSISVVRQMAKRQMKGTAKETAYLIQFETSTRPIRYLEEQMEEELKQGRYARYTKLAAKKRKLELARKEKLKNR